MTSILHVLAELEEQGEAGALCTIIQSRGSTPRHEGSKMLVFSDGRFMGTVGGGEVENRVRQEALNALLDGKRRLLKYEMVDPKQGDPGVCGGTVEVFVEPFLPPPTLVIIGGGHVGKAVAHLAHWLGFRVVVSDDRPEYCTKEANPDADFFVEGPMAELPAQLKITPQTYIVLTTRGVNVDVPGLPPLLDTPAAYIGIIGSKRRWMTTRNSLIETGVPEEKVKQVISPIGLELNAETPEEIAVSIMAEIIMLRNGGSGKSMDIE
jgi:xanthine dehydrogenase accessory factor